MIGVMILWMRLARVGVQVTRTGPATIQARLILVSPGGVPVATTPWHAEVS